MANRKEAEKIILEGVKKITGCEKNVELYVKMFKRMSNKEFDDFMEDLRTGRQVIQIIVPNGVKSKITVENNFKLAKSMGRSFIQKINFGKTDTTPAYRSAVDYLIIRIPAMRMSQMLQKKISVANDHKHVDQRSGQLTGVSKAARLTAPEISMLSAYGFDNVLTEFLKVRGGDLGCRQKLNELAYKNGRVTQEDVLPYSSGTKTNQVIEQYYLGMGIRASVNLGKR